MSKRKVSISVSKELEDLKRDSHGNFSGRLSIICDRFSEIMKDESPLKKFTEYEKAALIHKLRGRILEPAGLMRSLSKELRIGDQNLLEKLERLSYTETVSLVESIEKHWNDNPDESIQS